MKILIKKEVLTKFSRNLFSYFKVILKIKVFKKSILIFFRPIHINTLFGIRFNGFF